jgi:hypothetical protein
VALLTGNKCWPPFDDASTHPPEHCDDDEKILCVDDVTGFDVMTKKSTSKPKVNVTATMTMLKDLAFLLESPIAIVFVALSFWPCVNYHF